MNGNVIVRLRHNWRYRHRQYAGHNVPWIRDFRGKPCPSAIGSSPIGHLFHNKFGGRNRLPYKFRFGFVLNFGAFRVEAQVRWHIARPGVAHGIGQFDVEFVPLLLVRNHSRHTNHVSGNNNRAGLWSITFDVRWVRHARHTGTSSIFTHSRSAHCRSAWHGTEHTVFASFIVHPPVFAKSAKSTGT